MRFLTARWSHLALLNYRIPPALFAPYLPPDCIPDTSLDGHAYASFVAFDFLNTRLLGLPIPGFRNFPEINLRLYVTHVPTGHRGVLFVRELVPSRIISAVARWTYNEPYLALPMTSRLTCTATEISIEHHVRHNNIAHSFCLTAGQPASHCEINSLEHFFKEHRWGFNRSRSGKLIRYEVIHQHWRCFPVRDFTLNWDFGAFYGAQWAFLDDAPPDSVVFAEGSDIEVHLWRSLATDREG